MEQANRNGNARWGDARMTDWIDAALAPNMKRVQARPGRNGLSRSMNQALRAHPEIVEMIQRTMKRLIEWELLVGLSGMFRFRRVDLFRLLCEVEEDWGLEIPSVEYVGDPFEPMSQFLATSEMELPDQWGPTVVFKRTPRFKVGVFDSAITIAKRVGMVHGYGQLMVHPDLLKKLRILRKQRIPDEPKLLADDLGGFKEVNP